MMRGIFLLPLVLAAAGCAGTPPVGTSPGVTVANQSDLPPPTRADMASADRPYYIGPHDKLDIDVFGVEELRRTVQIDASGRLSFPLIGVVEASGKTPGELADTIEERLRGSFVRDPEVTVNLNETVSQIVTVDGQVAQPGVFPVVGKMTLERAVARAGGVTEFAKMSDVVVFRTVEGQRYAGLYNLQAIRRGNYPDPEIFAGDLIIVGDSKARRMFRDLMQVAPLLTTPLIILTNSN